MRTQGYGLRVTWDNLPGKPVAFPPTPHTHAWADITDKPTGYPPASHTHDWAQITGKPASFPPSAHTHGWAEITGKPTTYPPDAHTHPWDQITQRPATYPPSAHTHLWADITDKPATYPPSAHTHAIADVTGLQTALDGKAVVSHTHTIAQVTGLQAALDAKAAVGAATPKALGTANAGTSANASREDHVHPLPLGLTQFIGNVTVTEQAIVNVGLGMKRMTLPLPGVIKDEPLTFAPVSLATTGCEAVNVYAIANNQVTVSYYTPALGLLGLNGYSIPLAVFRITR